MISTPTLSYLVLLFGAFDVSELVLASNCLDELHVQQKLLVLEVSLFEISL